MCKIPQDPNYHNFADQRTLMDIPHFMNVVSNVPFLLVGFLGLRATTRPDWRWFFWGVLLTGFGSSYYHLNPTNETLVWDRLPMAIAFMALFSALSQDYGFRRLTLYPSLAFGVLSVLYWAWADDLSLYILVQFGSLLWILGLMVLRPSPFSTRRYLGLAFLGYALAKVLEWADAPFYAFLPVSGHTLKHLISALAAYAILCHVRQGGTPPQPPH